MKGPDVVAVEDKLRSYAASTEATIAGGGGGRRRENNHALASGKESLKRKMLRFESGPRMQTKDRMSWRESAYAASAVSAAAPSPSASGRRTVTVVPQPTSLSICIVPPWASASARTSARPRPVPAPGLASEASHDACSNRSEERRVGEEWRCRWSPYH